MVITYKNKKIQKYCEDFSSAKKVYGYDNTVKLHQRIDEIKAASNINFLLKHNIGGCHILKGDRKNQYALYLAHPFRLICTIVDNNITIACIEEVIDYH